MIYPTRRAVLILAVGAPVALLAGALNPAGWLAGPIWIAAFVLLFAVDVALAAPATSLSLDKPSHIRAAIGRDDVAGLMVRFARKRAPKSLEAAISGEPKLGVDDTPIRVPVENGEARLVFGFKPTRRGDSSLNELWTRWSGPLRLAYVQKRFSLGQPVPVRVDMRWVRNQAVRLFSRDAQFGTKAQIEMGQGSEFQSLRDFQTGMDRRAIDWKQSGRHFALLAKEFRTERNHNVIMALDCGRASSEPVAGMPRIDRFIHTALLMSYACLWSGDRAGLYAFDSRPRLSTGALSGINAFKTLQVMAGRIDYSVNETNYTLALATLSGELKRRSLIVIFTDFTDSIAAELMIESMGRILKRHLVLFVLIRDEELESLVATEPQTPEDVSRAVVAATLLRERETVISRLRRMGAHIVDSPAESLGVQAVNTYLDLKRRDLM